MNIEKTVRSLELRGFKVSRFATGKEAADYLAGALKGQTVGIGGSKTVDQIGLYDMLEEGSAFWHWRVPGDATYAAAATAQVYNRGKRHKRGRRDPQYRRPGQPPVRSALRPQEGLCGQQRLQDLSRL